MSNPPGQEPFFSSVQQILDEARSKGFRSTREFRQLSGQLVAFLVECRKTTGAKARARCPVTLPDGRQPENYLPLPPARLKIGHKVESKLIGAKSATTFLKFLWPVLCPGEPLPEFLMRTEKKRKAREEVTEESSMDTKPKTRIVFRPSYLNELFSDETPMQLMPSSFEPCVASLRSGQPEGLTLQKAMSKPAPEPIAIGCSSESILACMSEVEEHDGLNKRLNLAENTGKVVENDVNEEIHEDNNGDDHEDHEDHDVLVNPKKRKYNWSNSLVDDTVTEQPRLADAMQGIEEASGHAALPNATLANTSPISLVQLIDEVGGATSHGQESSKSKPVQSLRQISHERDLRCTCTSSRATRIVERPLEMLSTTLAHISDDLTVFAPENWARYEKKLEKLCASPEFSTFGFHQRLMKIVDICCLPEELYAMVSGDWDKIRQVAEVCWIITVSMGDESEKLDGNAKFLWLDGKLRDFKWLKRLYGAKQEMLERRELSLAA